MTTSDEKRFVAMATMAGGGDPLKLGNGPSFLPEIFANVEARDMALGPFGYEFIHYVSGGEISATNVNPSRHACGHRVDEAGFRTVIDPMIVAFLRQLGSAAMAVPDAFLGYDGWNLGGSLTIARTVYQLNFEFDARSQCFSPVIGHLAPCNGTDMEPSVEKTLDFLEQQICLFVIPGFRA